MKRVLSFSASQTRNIAKRLAKSKYRIFALTGGLGSGKTTFAQGFAKGLGIDKRVLSPTFTLIKQYSIPNHSGKFIHIDLYRIDDLGNILEEIKELLASPENKILIEWAEKTKALPKETIFLQINNEGSEKRELVFSGADLNF